MSNRIIETQKRITQNFINTIRQTAYKGELAPFGFKLVPCVAGENIGYCMTVSLDEAEDIKNYFSAYGDEGYTLEEAIEEANFFEKINPNSSDGLWDKRSFSNVLLNPMYIKADEFAYEYFQDSGCIIHNPLEDFTEGNACLVFSDHSDSMSRYIIKGCHVLLVPCKGIVSFDTWFKVREKWFRNRGN